MTDSLSINQRFFSQTLNENSKRLIPSAQKAFSALREKKCRGAEFTGWFDYPHLRGQKDLAAILPYVEKVRGSYDLVVVIGIGGSYLGTRAIADALGHSFQLALPTAKRQARQIPIVYMGHTVAESQFAELLDLLDGHEPIVNVVSKSGTTTEPAVAFRFLRPYLEKRYGQEGAAKRIVCTTDEKSGALRTLCNERHYPSFVIPGDVGGRFSVLTPVGLLPLALAGYDVKGFLKGADDLFATLRNGEVSYDHPVLTYARCRQAAYGSGKRIEILSHNDPKLVPLGEWWKQLFGESEGKEHKGLFPSQLLFTTDLHSLGQYAQDGHRDLLETFLVFKDRMPAFLKQQRMKLPALADNLDDLRYLEGRSVDAINDAALLATQIAHADGDVPCLEINCPKLDEYHLGYVMAFFETACAVSALMMGVNPFDQPGVESYKRNLFALMGKSGFEAEAKALHQRLEG